MSSTRRWRSAAHAGLDDLGLETGSSSVPGARSAPRWIPAAVGFPVGRSWVSSCSLRLKDRDARSRTAARRGGKVGSVAVMQARIHQRPPPCLAFLRRRVRERRPVGCRGFRRPASVPRRNLELEITPLNAESLVMPSGAREALERRPLRHFHSALHLESLAAEQRHQAVPDTGERPRSDGRRRVRFQDSQLFGRARADVHFGGPDVRVTEPQ